MISSRSIQSSVNVADRLGFVLQDKMDIRVFLPDPAQARDMLDFDIWRIAKGSEKDLEALVRQAGFLAGQVVAASASVVDRVEKDLKEALVRRGSNLLVNLAPFQSALVEYFHQGINDVFMDRYYLSRENWLACKDGASIE